MNYSEAFEKNLNNFNNCKTKEEIAKLSLRIANSNDLRNDKSFLFLYKKLLKSKSLENSLTEVYSSVLGSQGMGYVGKVIEKKYWYHSKFKWKGLD